MSLVYGLGCDEFVEGMIPGREMDGRHSALWDWWLVGFEVGLGKGLWFGDNRSVVWARGPLGAPMGLWVWVCGFW